MIRSYRGSVLCEWFVVSEVGFQAAGKGEGAEREGGVGEEEESMRNPVWES